jgi:mercuric ion transport protein
MSQATVELLFLPGCPHVSAARDQLRRAFAQVGLTPDWTERDITSPDAPVHVGGFGSPTILIDGRDVAGRSPGSGQACRVYRGSDLPGAPPLDDIVRALRALQGAR